MSRKQVHLAAHFLGVNNLGVVRHLADRVLVMKDGRARSSAFPPGGSPA